MMASFAITLIDGNDSNFLCRVTDGDQARIT